MAIPTTIDKLTVVCYPDPVLKKACPPVEAFTPELRALAEKMIDLMHAHRGVGLAAPQVGVPLRLFVANPTGEPEDNRVYTNPALSDLEGAATAVEGCLSIPEVNVAMRRAVKATIQAYDLDGQPFHLAGEDLLARIWQHETDHLDGRLIIDRMSEADEIANRKAIKQLRDDYRAAAKRSK